MGFKKLLMSHPDSNAVGATMEQVKEMAEMMRMFIGSMLSAGMSADEVDLMVRKNPGELLNV